MFVIKEQVNFTTSIVSKYRDFFGPYFAVPGLNTSEIYSINLRIQPEYGKILSRKNSIFGHFMQCFKAMF